MVQAWVQARAWTLVLGKDSEKGLGKGLGRAQARVLARILIVG